LKIIYTVGIYVNGEPLVSFYNTNSTFENKLLISKISSDQELFYESPQIETFPENFFDFSNFAPNTLEFVPFLNPNGTLEVSYGDLICQASYNSR
jgi:hypothetical protein